MNNEPLVVASTCALSAALVGALSLGCGAAARPALAAPARADATAAEHAAHVYRLDFAVASGGRSGAPVKEQFTLNLAERRRGDVSVGRSIPLQVGGSGSAPSPRTDVGLRLGADCASSGEDVLVRLTLEVSDADAALAGAPALIRKASASGDALVKLGQPALALRLDDGRDPYDVTVTATRLR